MSFAAGPSSGTMSAQSGGAAASLAARATTSSDERGIAGIPTIPFWRSMTTSAVLDGSIFSSTATSNSLLADGPRAAGGQDFLARDRLGPSGLVAIKDALHDLDERQVGRDQQDQQAPELPRQCPKT